MKERGIIMSPPMVRAILEGRKTQTRRVVKPQPTRHTESRFWSWKAKGWPKTAAIIMPPEWTKSHFMPDYCPHGVAGDRLWVRETHRFPVSQDGMSAAQIAIAVLDAGYRQPWSPKLFTADSAFTDHTLLGDFGGEWGRLRPSIHMPRWASRITLEITKVRVERLQDISDTDILAEGVNQDTLPSLLRAYAARQEVAAEHWVHGAEEGISYCRQCCEKEVAKLLKKQPGAEYCVDGGWDTEGDSIPHCDTCGKLLSNSLTDYGAEQEFEHFLENGCDLKSPNDCYSLLTAVESQMWTIGERFASDKDYQHENRVKRNELYHQVAWRVLWDSLHSKGAWERNPWVFVIEFKRL